jgi:rhodanese-related sulfurtransferase
MQDLTREQWKQMTAEDNEAVILDVRTQEEIDEGIIPEARHHDIYESGRFMDAIQQMDKSRNYYIYCRSGGRSAQACQIMDQMGFENTYNLLGGFSEWDGKIITP